MSAWTKPCVAVLALLLCATPAAQAAATCAGDCDGDRSVTVAELVTLINVALGERDVGDCPAGDANGNGAVEVDDLIAAVNQALFGCLDVEPGPFKTRVDHPWEPFFVFGETGDGSAWGKFTLRVDDPTTVYFQNANLVPFHQQFVAASLPPYIGWTAAQIDAVSLRAAGQQLVFGAVLYSPGEPHEIAIQLVRHDSYSVAEVVAYVEAVRAAIAADPGVPVFYFPTFEQRESALANEAALAAAGIRLGSPSRWSAGDSCYAHGWAHGRLVQVEGDDIAAAYADGRLGPDDILLTDGVPAEIPFVAGVVTLTPSTPNSHVAILAADWDIPFAFLSQPESVDAALALVGREVVLRATTLTPQVFTGAETPWGTCQVRLVDVEGALGAEVVAHLRDLKRAPDLQLRPFQRAGSYVREVDTATPDDIVFIGGKAANYGFLLRSTPGNARPAMAFTFDLWDEYLDQPIDGGQTLRQRIAALLAPFPTFPPADFAALYEALDEVRDLIDDEADFTDAQKQAIVAALGRFDPLRRIHFRSSTNVEDSDLFTGAGLYDSESGCLADDIDDDTTGPSRCDPERAGERGVFRALRKVFLSFYSDNAFLERLRHRVDETTVGMAVLVHHTFVDETELANGVAALRVGGPTSAYAAIVSQPGVYSVTNPEDDGLPEIVEASWFGSAVYPSLRQGAERLPLGATVLDWQGEYVQLMNLLRAVAQAFGAFHGETQFDVEFEFKKVAGEGLVLRQVRRMPRAAEVETPPVLIDAPTRLCVFQGETSDAFAIHRLKSRWSPVFISGPVDPAASVYADATHTYVLDDAVATLAGMPAAWPGATHGEFATNSEEVLGLSDSWDAGAGDSLRRMTLRTHVPTTVGPARLPIVFPDDLAFLLEARHESAVPFLDYPRQPATRHDDEVWLVPCRDEGEPGDDEIPVRRLLAAAGFAFDIGFHWPPEPGGIVAGYTAPLVRWTRTAIAGATLPAATLSGYFSQTYRPGHHNFTETFVFEPRLEEGIPPAVREAWDAAGLRAVVVEAGSTSAPLFGWTLDDRLVEPGADGGGR